jgi:zinc protease
MTANMLRAGAWALVAAVMAASPSRAQTTAVVPPRPTPGPPKVFEFPKINTQTLPNGMRLAVIENHELPLVAVRFGFLGGPFLDAPGKEGGWELMMNALREGTTMRSASSIADAFADLGTTIDWSAVGMSPSNGAPSFTTLKSAWQPALRLVAEILTYPSFPTEAVNRLQAAQANAASRPRQDQVPLRVISPVLYGGDHQYTRTLLATDSSVRRITHEDIVGLYASYVRPQNTVVVIAGDITLANARAAVEKAFSGWQRTEKVITSKALPSTTQPAPTTIYLRDFPGATQTMLMVGTSIPSRASIDGAALETVNSILGGATAGSRLYDALRTSRGLAYAANSVVQWRPEPQSANWLVTTTVRTEKADTAVTEAVRVLRELHGDRPITEDELEFSRRNLTVNLPNQLETVDNQANNALGLLKNGLPLNFNADNVNRINALTLSDVRSAASKYIDPEHLIIAVVGDRAKLEAPLRATGIPVVIVEH